MKTKSISILILISIIITVPIISSEKTWNINTVDSEGYIGEYASIAVDNNNYPHISYYDFTYDDLKYAKWNGNNWDIQVVDPHTGDSLLTDISIDSMNNAHISYHDSIYADLKYAHWTGTSWDIQTIDSTGNVGYKSSIAIDNNNYPHISYYDYTNQNLKYTKWNGNNWETQTIVSDGNVGTDSSITLDSKDYPHISYYDFTNMELKYTKWNGNNWEIETIDTTMDVGFKSSIALDSNDFAHISYYDYTLEDLKYAHWTGSEWEKILIESEGDVGEFNSIVLDEYDRPHISYYDYTNADLKYSYWDGNTWDIQTIDSGGYVGSHSSIAIDKNAVLHIGYFDFSNAYLKYAFSEQIQKYIELNQPNGNEVIEINQNYEIKWNSNNAGNYVNLYLYKQNELHSIIAENIENNGNYIWTPQGVEEDTNFKIKINSSSDSEIYDYSNQNFSIIINGLQTEIIVLSPQTQNEIISKNQDYEIKWLSNNIENCVNIYLYEQENYDRIIISETSNDGSYIWNTPNDLEENKLYKFKIESCTNQNIYNFSTNYFKTSSEVIDYIKIIQPNGGEILSPSSINYINWESNNNQGYVKIKLWNESENSIIIENTSNNGKYSWKIPNEQIIGSNYKIQIIKIDESNQINDFSDNTFTINISKNNNTTNNSPKLYITVFPEEMSFNKGESLDIKFLVHDSKGTLIPNATIEINILPPLYTYNNFQGYTNSNGYYQLTANCYTQGQYPITIITSKEGYEPAINQEYITVNIDFWEQNYTYMIGLLLIAGVICGVIIGIVITNRRIKKQNIRKPKKTDQIITEKKEIQKVNKQETLKKEDETYKKIDDLLKSLDDKKNK